MLTQPKGRMKVLAAIPCFNERLAIGSVALLARKHVDAVLVIDDGSRDGTADVAREAGASVISHEQNKGKGAAVKSALTYAAAHGFDALVLLDGDGQHDPDQIPQLLQPIQDGTADIVIGYRELNQMPRYRRVGRLVLDYTTAAGKMTKDSQSGYRALNRTAIEALQANHLEANGFAIESEMIMVARNLPLKISEVPITCTYEVEKPSTENPMKHGFGVLGTIIHVIAEGRPLLYISVPGLILILIGFYFGLTLLRQYNRLGYFSLPYTMLAGFFIIVGVMGVFIGMVLNVISRLLKEHEKEKR
jgi:glycosyltransferase involved in cell wall biosynthesis